VTLEEPATTTSRAKQRSTRRRAWRRIMARRAADGGIDVSGSIGCRRTAPLLARRRHRPVHRGALRAALQSAGITVDGALKAGRRRRARRSSHRSRRRRSRRSSPR
jgi:hypothetical protein